MSSPIPQSAAIRLFCSYAPEDEPFRIDFEKALGSLRRSGLLDIWSDQRILAGMDVRAAVDEALDSSSIIVTLISNSFINSDRCWEHELRRAFERRDRGEARLIPVLVGPCFWENTPIAALKPLPADAKPVTLWANQDDAWTSVAVGVNEVVKDIQFEGLRRTVPTSVRDMPSESDALKIRKLLEKLATLRESQPSVEFSAEELMKWGDARFVSRDIDESIRLYRSAIAAAPENATGWRKLAFAFDEGHRRFEPSRPLFGRRGDAIAIVRRDGWAT